MNDSLLLNKLLFKAKEKTCLESMNNNKIKENSEGLTDGAARARLGLRVAVLADARGAAAQPVHDVATDVRVARAVVTQNR